MKINQVQVKNYLTKSKLPASDYVINPYVGCPHACKYCYATFMKRFTKHDEPWGEFVDIKICDKDIEIGKLKDKTVFISSVTDCYNKLEQKYEITRNIISQLRNADCEINISTKSNLILRDIDLLKECKKLKVAISINTLDEKFKNDMDSAASIADRLEALKALHDSNIYTVLFMSPIFPGITDCKSIIDATHDYVDEYWFEDLNLRGGYKQEILSYVRREYPDLSALYSEIYEKKSKAYWEELSDFLKRYCESKSIRYINYFDHTKLVAEKKERN